MHQSHIAACNGMIYYFQTLVVDKIHFVYSTKKDNFALNKKYQQ